MMRATVTNRETMRNETRAIERTAGGPVTSTMISAGLKALGVRDRERLLVHASLSSFGFVAGGAQAVVAALQATVGAGGLLVAPAFTSHLSDPVHWRAPPVPEDWWATIRSETAPFDAAVTPSRGMGAISELLRTSPGAVRGAHPHVSFAAWGSRATELVTSHDVAAWLGDGSPLHRLYELDAKVLFLGTGFSTCTAFHLGEHRAGALRFRSDGAPIILNNRRAWVTFAAPDYDTDPFADLGARFEAQSEVMAARIGAAECRLFSIRAAVKFAEAWARNANVTA